MTGQILDYSIQTNSGVISGDDGNRYTFQGEDWKEPGMPQQGMRVDFDVDGGAARGIYSEERLGGAAGGGQDYAGGQTYAGNQGYAGGTPGVGAYPVPAPGVKSRTTAGILAILLGQIGVHKFYLGHVGIGFLHIVISFTAFFVSCGVGCVVGIFTFGAGFLVGILIALLIIWGIGIVEGIMYLTKTDEEFYRIYVVERRSFF